MTVLNRRIAAQRTQADSGFTLIEVVVAIALLLIVTTASLYFVSKSRFTSSDQQATQIAATLASSTMEQVYAAPASINPATQGVPYLYTGRYITDVQTEFAANSTVAGVSSTFPVWDSTKTASTTPTTKPFAACPSPTLSVAKTPLVPLLCTNIVNGTTYTITTLIGVCYRPASYTTATAGSQNCTAPTLMAPTASNPLPIASSSSLIQETRVIVIVAWNSPSSCPLAGGCTYSTATLFNYDADPLWASS